MADYILSGCSTADLSAEHFENREIHCINFHFALDDVWYEDDQGQSVAFADFYQKMRDGATTKTSQIPASEYEDYFRGMLDEGKDVIHLSLSSGISGTVNSAELAARELRGEYPDRKIWIIDSLAASSGYGLLLDLAADQRDKGLSAESLVSWIQEERYFVNHWFFSTDLKWYVKGGRISKAAGFVGGLLQICPLLHVDQEGKLIPLEKIRSKKMVIKAIVEKMKLYAKDGRDYSGKCYISMSDCPELAEPVAKLVEENFPKLNGKVEINHIGTTIGAHTGPGTVALFFEGRDRREPLL